MSLETGLLPLGAVLFDIDNTLVNFFELHDHSYSTTFQHIFGIDARLGDIKFSGKTTPNIFREIGLEHGLAPAFIEGRVQTACDYLAELTRVKLENLADKINQYILPGVIEALQVLQAHQVLLGVLSGNPTKLGQLVLRVTKLEHYFQVYTFGDEANSRAELAQLSLTKLEHLINIKPSQVLIVGDALADVAAAQAVGAVSLAVATGFHNIEELAQAKPDFLLASLTEFEAVFKRIQASA